MNHKKIINRRQKMSIFTIGETDKKLQPGSISILKNNESCTSFAHAVSDYIKYVMFVADWTPAQVHAFLKIFDADVFTKNIEPKIEPLGISIKLYQYNPTTQTLNPLFHIGKSYHVAHIMYDDSYGKFFLISSMHSLYDIDGRSFQYLKVTDGYGFTTPPKSKKLEAPITPFKKLTDESLTETPQIETSFRNNIRTKTKPLQLKEKKSKKRKLQNKYITICGQIVQCELLYKKCADSITCLSKQLLEILETSQSKDDIILAPRLKILSEIIDLLAVQNDTYKSIKLTLDILIVRKNDIKLCLETV